MRIKNRTIKGLSGALLLMGILVSLYPLYTSLYSYYQQNILLKEFSEPAVVAPLEIINEDLDMSKAEINEVNSKGNKTITFPEASPLRDMNNTLKKDADKIQALMLLEIPDINLSAIVVAGTSQEALKTGPGWYEQSASPGNGNTAIAGHKDMYGSWFKNVHKLKPGNQIFISFKGKRYCYLVQTVYPIALDDWSVIAPTKEPMLTLTTCYSKDQRLACRAVLNRLLI